MNEEMKEKLEFWNSIFWFFMDAMWMFSNVKLSLILTVPTVITGILTVFCTKKPTTILVDLSMVFWMIMNIFWLIGEEFNKPELILYAKCSFFSGIFLLFVVSMKFEDGYQVLVKSFRRYKKPHF